MLDQKIIVPSMSPWASPCVLVKKKDNTMRFCVDYRALNRVSVPQRFPLPLLTDVWDCLSQNHSSIFTTLDMRSGYFQIPLDQETQEKTAFVVQDGTYQFTRLPFGVQSGPSIYQKTMNEVFRGLTFRKLIVYIDDVMIFSKDFETHMIALKEVFERLRNAGLKLHPKKCKIAATEITYLGHKISGAGIRVDESKIAVVKTWPVPVKIKDVRAFLGYTGYHRKFIYKYAKKAGPLNNLLRKDAIFHWDKKCQEAFEELRAAMTTTPILSHADMTKPFILTTDASGESIGYVLSQIGGDQKEHPISFSGRSLRNAERNYSVTEKEGLAMIEGIREFYPYLFNNHFSVVTDHVSLRWIQQIKHGNGRLFRWSLALQRFDFTVTYRQGRANANADGLSRRPYEKTPEEEPENDYIDDSFELAHLDSKIEESESVEIEEDDMEDDDMNDDEDRELAVVKLEYDKPPQRDERLNKIFADNILAIENLQDLQQECPELGRIIQFLRVGELPLEPKLARQTVYEADDYFFRDGLLMHKCVPKNKNFAKGQPIVEQLAIPVSLRSKILQEFHDGCGHNSHVKTFASIMTRYYWPKIFSDCFLYCKSCRICQQIKSHTHPPRAPLGVWPSAGIFERIHLDFLGPLPKTKEGNQHVLLVVDSKSRWPESFAMKSQGSKEVANVLFNEIYCRYGTVKVLVSDRGQNFLSKVVARLSKLLKIRRCTTSGYRPQSNASCEQFNRTILQCLRAYCKDQTEWDKFLQPIMYAYRGTVSASSTLYSPYKMLYGKEMTLPIDCELDVQSSTGSATADEYVKQLVEKLKVIHKVARENEKEYQEKYKKRYDKGTAETNFTPGTIL